MSYEILDALADVIDEALEMNQRIQAKVYRTEMLLAKQETMLQKEADKCAELKCKYMKLEPKIEQKRSPEVERFIRSIEVTLGYPGKEK